ncbi:MAG: site-2 protease family protein [Candidatus Limnocylindria bacterium]
MNALPIARILGFEVRVHVSWALVLALIVVSVVTQVDGLAPGVTGVGAWVVGAVVAASFLVSALAHELGHAVAARRAGVPGGPVVVFVFGGAAGPDLLTRRPRDEASVALAGPLVSLVAGIALAGTFAVILALGDGAPSVVMIVGRIAVIIGALNLLLGLVNLLPAYPLDGGRLVRAAVWSRTGDPTEGLRAAAVSGRWLGRLAGVAGFALILLVDAIDGLFVAIAGWFLITVARAVERSATVDDLLDGATVDDVMERDVTGVPAALTLDTFADQVLDRGTSGVLPVMRDDVVIGLLGADRIRRIRRDRWPTTRAGDVVDEERAMPTVAPDTPLRTVLDLLQEHATDGLAVHDGGRFAGIVTRRAVVALVRQRAQERGIVP